MSTPAPIPLETVRVVPWRVALFALFAGNGLALGTWASRTPATAEALEVGLAQMGLLLTSIPIGALLGLLASSHILERLGERRTLLASQLLGLLGFGGFGLVAQLTGNALACAALLALFGVGLATSNIVINLEAAASDRISGRTLMPMFHAAFSIGVVVGAGLGALASAFSLSLALHFPALSCVVLLTALVVTRFLPELREAHSTPPSFAERMKVWVEPRTLLIGLIVLAAAFTEGSANGWLALAMVQGRDWSPSAAATTVTVFAASMVLGRVFGGWVVDRIGRVAALRAAFSLAVVGILVVALIDGAPATFVGVALWGLGASLGYPLGVSAAADNPRNAPARVAAVATVATISGLLGPSALGVLGEHVGLPQAFVVVAALALVAVLVTSAARPPRTA